MAGLPLPDNARSAHWGRFYGLIGGPRSITASQPRPGGGGYGYESADRPGH